MPRIAFTPQLEVAVLINDLAESLEGADPEARKAAAEKWRAWKRVKGKGRPAPTVFDYAHILATIHSSGCRDKRKVKCVGCALARAILLCCIVADEKDDVDLALVVGAELPELLPIYVRLATALNAHRKSTRDSIKMRQNRFTTAEWHRIEAVRKMAGALHSLLKSLVEVSRVLLKEDIYRTMAPSLRRKSGASPKVITKYVMKRIRDETGLGDKRIGDLLGYSKDDVRQRRRKGGKKSARPNV